MHLCVFPGQLSPRGYLHHTYTSKKAVSDQTAFHLDEKKIPFYSQHYCWLLGSSSFALGPSVHGRIEKKKKSYLTQAKHLPVKDWMLLHSFLTPNTVGLQQFLNMYIAITAMVLVVICEASFSATKQALPKLNNCGLFPSYPLFLILFNHEDQEHALDTLFWCLVVSGFAQLERAVWAKVCGTESSVYAFWAWCLSKNYLSFQELRLASAFSFHFWALCHLFAY